MSVRNALAILTPLFLVSLLVGCDGCGQKGGDLPAVENLPTDAARAFDLLFARRDEAKVKTPLAAIPDGLEWTVSSPDPAAWAEWAKPRPFTQALLKTPLAQEAMTSHLWLALDGLGGRAAQAAALVGAAPDKKLLWKGPTAIGLNRKGSGTPQIVVVKTVDKALGELVRYAGVFALIEAKQKKAAKEGSKAKQEEKPSQAELKIVTVEQSGRELSFALFSNLIIIGTDRKLVERAYNLALDAPDEGDVGAHKTFSEVAEKPGVHVRFSPKQPHPIGVLSVFKLGVSFLPDEQSPALVWRQGKVADKAPLSLLAYAPESTALAWAEGGKPGDTILKAFEARLVKDKSRLPFKKGALEAFFATLSPGSAFFIQGPSAESPKDLGFVMAFRHEGKKAELGKQVEALMQAGLQGRVRRTRLAQRKDALLMETGSAAAAVTDDAVLVSMDAKSLRAALDAGAAAAPSLGDKGVDAKAKAPGAVYVNLARVGASLSCFYEGALRNDRNTPWKTAKEQLSPTFSALDSGGSWYAELEATKDGRAERSFRAVR